MFNFLYFFNLCISIWFSIYNVKQTSFDGISYNMLKEKSRSIMPSFSIFLKMKIRLFPGLPIDQNENPSSCNQVRSSWLFVQSVIKFHHSTIHRCLHGSIADSLLRSTFTSRIYGKLIFVKCRLMAHYSPNKITDNNFFWKKIMFDILTCRY